MQHNVVLGQVVVQNSTMMYYILNVWTMGTMVDAMDRNKVVKGHGLKGRRHKA
jgi:hypothetical protein